MKLKRIKKLSDYLFVASILFSLGVLLKSWFDRKGLPEGVCPIDNNSQWITMAITLLVISFVATSLIDFYTKKHSGEE